MPSNATLTEQITAEGTRPSVVAECVTLIDGEVKSKGGLGGVALRGAYATIKAIKRGFVAGVVDALLDDWVAQLEKYYTGWRAGTGTSFTEYVTARSEDVAEDLLKVTDERAATTKHTTARKAYNKMRGSAKKHVTAAVPKLGGVMEQHLV
jgi:hypothetical protein